MHTEKMNKFLRDAGCLQRSLQRPGRNPSTCVIYFLPQDGLKNVEKSHRRMWIRPLQWEGTGRFYNSVYRWWKFDVLNLFDAGTGYGERCISKAINSNFMRELYEKSWVCRHGSPSSFSAGPEFCRPFSEKFLKSHITVFRAFPSRSSHKNGRL